MVAEAAALVAGGAAVLAEATGTMGRAAAAISCACADLLSRLGREVLLRFFVGDMVIAVVVVVLPDCACICKVSSTLCGIFAYIFADASNARGLFACAYQTRRDFSKVGGLLRKRARTSDFDTLVSTYSCSMWSAQAWGPTRRYYYPVVIENAETGELGLVSGQK